MNTSRKDRLALSPERLYSANLGLVGVVMRRFPFLTGEDREDADAAGKLGLWEAARRYDPALGFAFGSFAGKYIRGHILRRLKAEKQQQRLYCVSLETPLSGKGSSSGEDGGELADLVADPAAEKPGEKAMEAAAFEALIARLPDRYQAVIRGVYQDDMTLQEIGDAAGMTRQGVYGLHDSAIRRLRKQEGQRQARQQRGW